MNDIINLFTKEHGLYKNVMKYNVILSIIIIVFLLSRLNISLYILFSIMLAIYLVNIYVRMRRHDLEDNNKIINVKLDTLQSKIYEYIRYKIKMSGEMINNQNELYEKNKLDSLYIDAKLITFLYSILPLYKYNPQEFYLLLKGTNNILKLRNDIERYYRANGEYPENIHEMLQIAIQLKTNCMNNLQNFIYTVPKQNKMYSYIDNVLVTYNILISRNIKIMHNYHLDYIKRNGINTNTIFIDINSPKAFDENVNKAVVPSKEGLKHSLIDLYV